MKHITINKKERTFQKKKSNGGTQKWHNIYLMEQIIN